MKTTMNIPEDLVKKTMLLSKSKTKTEAVITAMKEFVRRKKLEKIIDQAGTLEFSDDWERARHGR
jgi:Arc/MetJ family transcription regulator